MDTLEQEFDLIDTAIALKDPIKLNQEIITHALALNREHPTPNQPLGTYTKSLALSAFVAWYQQYNLAPQVNYDHCTLYQDYYNQVLSGVLNLHIGEFKVGLITITCMDDEFSLDPMMLHLPELANHFYVVMHIEDEANLAQVKGFFNYQQLQQFKSQLELDDELYYGDFDLLEHNTTHLLVQLAALDSQAIALPSISQEQIDHLEKTKANLGEFITYLQDYLYTKSQELIWSASTLLQGAMPATLDSNRETPSAKLNAICQQISLKYGLSIPGNVEVFSDSLDFEVGTVNVHFLAWPSPNGDYYVLAIAEDNRIGDGVMRLVTAGHCECQNLALNEYAYALVEANQLDSFIVAIEINDLTKRSKPFSCQLLESTSHDD